MNETREFSVLAHKVGKTMYERLTDAGTIAATSVVNVCPSNREVTLLVRLPQRTREAEVSVHRAYAQVAREFAAAVVLDLEIDVLLDTPAL